MNTYNISDQRENHERGHSWESNGGDSNNLVKDLLDQAGLIKNPCNVAITACMPVDLGNGRSRSAREISKVVASGLYMSALLT